MSPSKAAPENPSRFAHPPADWLIGDSLLFTQRECMKPGHRSFVRSMRWGVLAGAMLLSGCVSLHKHTEPPPAIAEPPLDPAEAYTLACPDVIWVGLAGYPGMAARVDVDGCIRLGWLEPIHVEGETSAEASAHIADAAGMPRQNVLVQVMQFNSRQIFLFGQVQGGPRVVAYRGPERVVDVLQRMGGLSAAAATNEIYVVRAQLGEGIPAEVLTVDLEAIRHRDERSNIRVQPLDEIYVGEIARSRIGKAVPTFLKPFYESLVELVPRRDQRPAPASPPSHP
jgi:protein involved in polysaccharide export with SLBB domain